MRGIEIAEENYMQIASKLQEELAEIVRNGIEVNDYQLIMYKYLFISELKVPLWEDYGIEVADGSFMLYVIPDGLDFRLLRRLDDAFDEFEISFMPNDYGMVKLRFGLCD